MIDISELTEHSVNVNGFNSNPNIHGHAKKVLQKIIHKKYLKKVS